VFNITKVLPKMWFDVNKHFINIRRNAIKQKKQIVLLSVIFIQINAKLFPTI